MKQWSTWSKGIGGRRDAQRCPNSTQCLLNGAHPLRTRRRAKFLNLWHQLTREPVSIGCLVTPTRTKATYQRTDVLRSTMSVCRCPFEPPAFAPPRLPPSLKLRRTRRRAKASPEPMQLGLIGLGRMGGNMARRLMAGGHDGRRRGIAIRMPLKLPRALAAQARLAGRSRAAAHTAARRLDHGAGRRRRPKHTVTALAARLSVRRRHHRRRQHALQGRRPAGAGARGRRASTTSTSGRAGGVWGAERGYCLMIGGEPATVARLTPLFRRWRPASAMLPPTPTHPAATTAPKASCTAVRPAPATSSR